MLLAVTGAILSQILYGNYLLLVADSNKIFAVLVSVSSILWFKNLNVRHNKIINAIGGSTFGVLLIHANSDAMRTWLWRDTVDCIGHYDLPLGRLILYSTSVVLIIFTLSISVDQIRIRLIEKPFFRWYEKYLNNKLQSRFGSLFDAGK